MKSIASENKVTWKEKIQATPIYLLGKGDFLFGFTAYFTHFEPIQSLVGAKTGEPQEKHLTTRKQNMSCLTYHPS